MAYESECALEKKLKLRKKLFNLNDRHFKFIWFFDLQSQMFDKLNVLIGL